MPEYQKASKPTSAGDGAFVAILLAVVLFAVFLGGGFFFQDHNRPNTNVKYILATPTTYGGYNSLELHTLNFITTIPTAIPPVAPALCKQGGANSEAEILVGYAPAQGQSVGSTGQIKVWVNDENPPLMAPGEVLNSATGQITTPGNRASKAPDGYLWEPALYISPQTAETGGTPHFPSFAKGHSSAGNVPNMDPVPPGSQLSESFTDEYIWDVASLGLTPGTYEAEFVIHDGDDDRGVGCVAITIL